MPEWLKSIFGMIPGVGDLISGIVSGVSNYKQQELANKQNLFLVDKHNQAAARESEKAYQRSRASTQVADMMAAGMSKAGALNAINGGGSYTPAPVNAGQTQAPQMDLSQAFDGLLATAENAKQRKLQLKLADKQIKAQEDAQKAQFEENEKQRKHDLLVKEIDTANQTHAQYLEYEKHRERLALDKSKLQWEKEIYDRLPNYEKERYDLGTELLRKQTDLELWKVNDLKYKVLEYQSLPYKTTRDGENLLRGIAAEFNYNLTEKDMREFRDTYMYYDKETNEWKYKRNGNNPASQWLYENSPRFWDFMARVIPANKLGDIISRALSGK